MNARAGCPITEIWLLQQATPFVIWDDTCCRRLIFMPLLRKEAGVFPAPAELGPAVDRADTRPPGADRSGWTYAHPNAHAL